jgi:hypothetical protein
MAACHAAGIEREDFIAWSVSDPKYAKDGDEIRQMWDALKLEGNDKGRITEATLFRALKQDVDRSLPVPPNDRAKMSRKEADDINRIVAWAGRQTRDENKFFWACCELGRFRMSYVVDDAGLERMLLDAGWKADLWHDGRRWSRERVLRQIRNGLRHGSLGVSEELLEEINDGDD